MHEANFSLIKRERESWIYLVKNSQRAGRKSWNKSHVGKPTSREEMTHQQQRLPFLLPDLPELLLASRTPTALCCFAGLARRAREGSSLPMEPELSTLAAEATEPAATAVHVYQPQSARLNRDGAGFAVVRRVYSTETSTATSAPMLERRSLSATLPGVQPQQQHLWMLDVPYLPSLFGSLLRRRGDGERNDGRKLSRQRCTWDAGELLDDDAPVSGGGGGGTGNGHVGSVDNLSGLSDTVNAHIGAMNGHNSTMNGEINSASSCTETLSSLTDAVSVPTQISTSCPNETDSTPVDIVESHTEVRTEFVNCPTDMESAQADISKCSPMDIATESADIVSLRVNSRSAVQRDADISSDVVQTYLDSVLESLSGKEDKAPFVDTVDGAQAGNDVDNKIDSEFDANMDVNIYRLLLTMDEPIGESTARDAALTVLDASEAELARGPTAACAASVADADINADADADAHAHADVADCRGRLLSDTGSEVANAEFHFLRTMTLPPLPQNQPAPPTMRRAETLGEERRSRLLGDKAAAPDGRKRLHKRRKSYAMTGQVPGALPDWGDRPAVLLSARPPPPSPPQPRAHTPRQPGQSVSTTPRAVVFHPPALAGRAAYLVNFLASSGQPACRWQQLLSQPLPVGDCKRRRSGRRRIVARLFGGGGVGVQQAEVTAALRQCATEGHLAVLLLPATIPKVGDAGSGESGKFFVRLRSGLADLEPPGLPAGLVVVFAGRGDIGDSADAVWWASAAGPTSPTLTVSGGSASGADAPGLECCRAVLAAARQCAALVDSRRLL